MSAYVNRLVPTCIGSVVQNERVLLLKRRKPPYQGFWTLPGGKVEVGEHPHDTVAREFFEETGLRAEVARYCGAVSEVHHEEGGASHFLLYVFRLKLTVASTPTASEEGELAWVPISALGERSDVAYVDAWLIRHLLLAESGAPLVVMETKKGEEAAEMAMRIIP